MITLGFQKFYIKAQTFKFLNEHIKGFRNTRCFYGLAFNDRFVSLSTTNYVVNAVRQIVNEATVAPDRVTPYGCSVKYKPRSR